MEVSSTGVPWGWIWFTCAILAFLIGYFASGTIKSFFATKKEHQKKSHQTNRKPLPTKPPPTSDGGTCSFEQEDIILGHVKDYSGKKVSRDTVPCSQCNQYLYSDEDGESPMGFWREASRAGASRSYVCTVGQYTVPKSKSAQKSCTSDADCNGAPCQGGKCTVWS